MILQDPAKRSGIIRQIRDTLLAYGLQGVNIDFEEILEKNNEPLSAFGQELYETLHPEGLLVSMDVSPGNEDYDYQTLSKYNDHIILMAYDEFNDATPPGPISSQKWIEARLDELVNKIGLSKIVLGVAGYGRDWVTDEEGNHVDDITYAAAIDNAKLANAPIEFDNDTYNLHYSFNEPETDSTGEIKHHIWFTDAATTFNVLRFSDDYPTAGTALWHLGGEDPGSGNFTGEILARHPYKKNRLILAG